MRETGTRRYCTRSVIQAWRLYDGCLRVTASVRCGHMNANNAALNLRVGYPRHVMQTYVRTISYLFDIAQCFVD